MSEQLPLKFPLREEFTLDRFRVGLNRELIETAASNERVWIYGEARVGKTHLAQAICGKTKHSAFLPGKTTSPYDVDLDNYGAYRHLVIDDIDCWLGHRDIEDATRNDDHMPWRRVGSKAIGPPCCEREWPNLH